MSTADLIATIFVVVGGTANIFFAWQQNHIFREQNKIFAAQAGMKMPETTSRNRLGLYWPALAAGIIAVVVGLIVARLKPVGALAVAVPWSLSVMLVFVAVYLWKQSKGDPALKAERPVEPIYTVNFDYLPLSPLENGWTRAYHPDAVVEFATDPEISGSLRINVKSGELAIDHTIPPHGCFSDRLLFKVKLSPSTMIFTRLEVTNKDRSERKQVWMKYYADRTARAERTPGDWHNPTSQIPEQTVRLPFKTLGNGVTEYDIDFHKSVELALGSQGWIYNAVNVVRLRGNLSLSPLVFKKNMADINTE
jgi:hypothetical protein